MAPEGAHTNVGVKTANVCVSMSGEDDPLFHCGFFFKLMTCAWSQSLSACPLIRTGGGGEGRGEGGGGVVIERQTANA